MCNFFRSASRPYTPPRKARSCRASPSLSRDIKPKCQIPANVPPTSPFPDVRDGNMNEHVQKQTVPTARPIPQDVQSGHDKPVQGSTAQNLTENETLGATVAKDNAISTFSGEERRLIYRGMQWSNQIKGHEQRRRAMRVHFKEPPIRDWSSASGNPPVHAGKAPKDDYPARRQQPPNFGSGADHDADPARTKHKDNPQSEPDEVNPRKREFTAESNSRNSTWDSTADILVGSTASSNSSSVRGKKRPQPPAGMKTTPHGRPSKFREISEGDAGYRRYVDPTNPIGKDTIRYEYGRKPVDQGLLKSGLYEKKVNTIEDSRM